MISVPHRVIVTRDDPYLVAIKAELLHAMPELTGEQINAAAMFAVLVIKRLEENDYAIR